MDYILDEMKERIKMLKKTHNINSEQLSELSGVPIGTLNKLLGKATKEPSINSVIKIARAFGVTADYLIFGNEEQSEPKAEILTKYNRLNDLGKQMADNYIDYLLANCQNVQSLKSTVSTVCDFDIADDITETIKANKVNKD